MYDIVHWNRGRLGNSLFRYFASIVLHLKNPTHVYSHQRTNNGQTCDIDDKTFLALFNNGQLPATNIHLTGYYQYQELIHYKDEILKFAKYHPQDVLQTDRNESYLVGKILHTDVPLYDWVIHIRLEDFVGIGEYIQIDTLLCALENMPLQGTIAIVMNSPTTEFEKNYLRTILDFLIQKHIIPVLEKNTIERDFAIMRNCKHLVCSKSTISWCAAFLSETIQSCYMPDYTVFREHQTMKRPHENTIFYAV